MPMLVTSPQRRHRRAAVLTRNLHKTLRPMFDRFEPRHRRVTTVACPRRVLPDAHLWFIDAIVVCRTAITALSTAGTIATAAAGTRPSHRKIGRVVCTINPSRRRAAIDQLRTGRRASIDRAVAIDGPISIARLEVETAGVADGGAGGGTAPERRPFRATVTIRSAKEHGRCKEGRRGGKGAHLQQ